MQTDNEERQRERFQSGDKLRQVLYTVDANCINHFGTAQFQWNQQRKPNISQTTHTIKIKMTYVAVRSGGIRSDKRQRDS